MSPLPGAMPKLTERLAIDLLVRWQGSPFPWTRWTVVPNVSHGWIKENYEADLIALSRNGWAQEVEVKLSASDLRADRKKRKHGGGQWPGKLDERIKRFWYAVPPELVVETERVAGPGDGIIVLTNRATVHRNAAVRRKARRCTDAERIRLLECLGARYWSARNPIRPYITGELTEDNKDVGNT